MNKLLDNKVITFLGAGSIAEAIIAGLINENVLAPTQIVATNATNRKRLTYLENTYGITTTPAHTTAVEKGDIVILAMKPQQIKEAIELIRPSVRPEQLFVSIAAGTPTDYIEQLLGEKASVIRAMPNTSAKVGASATAISKGTHATDVHIEQVETLFEAIGTVIVVTESKLDAVTGLAGSGPAFFYYLIEAMEDAGVEAGLTEEEARQLIIQTVVGVGKRLEQTTKSPEELYTEVMSPNGTTEAGIDVLHDREAQDIMKTAVVKAIIRSKELGSLFTV